MLTYLFLSCNTCNSLCSLTNLKVLHINKTLKNVSIESFYPNSLKFLQCYSNSLPKKLPITQLVLNVSLKEHNIYHCSCLCSLKILGLVSYLILLPTSLTSLTVSCFGLSQNHISFKDLNYINVKELHIENCITQNVELPSCLDSLYLHYSVFEIINPVSKESEFINTEWYYHFLN
ncbi:hypothetical protein EDI_318840 [Entamoeba dispar SAW760]|uniref:Leucine rich repeat containing protein BspA family protein n=1 Tax=Entamoeba dispar (strain ATCC PRA-260 / SAW760) TaxID=370354 RepID=B0EKA7_ENTDS|nr:uncharacterized protein EDI_318840 [Entamoeba dispar SAW760]EDR25040.1 hypothetical protein EDI_318840 [Entamoeba dispar SAW760]|eukprot:EDR25040.1 hypothetical protein EDI_318840 [Entamoeba dispar SAW760]